MSLSSFDARQHSAFARWIRTGFRLPEPQVDPPLEVKFNPYHDPANGQFTFGPGGSAGSAGAGMTSAPKRPHRPDGDRRWTGDFHGGGGGTGGGGGATGSYPWPDAAAKPKDAEAPRNLQTLAILTRVRPTPTFGPHPKPQPTTVIRQNGYAFTVDASHRTQRTHGELKLANAQRSTTNQSRAGGADRLGLDDGGHFIASRFNGPKDAFNHFAQNRNFNRGAYRTLEEGWAKDLKAGKRVSVDITADYAGTSRRPRSLVVHWLVDGREHTQHFNNAPKGK